MDAAIKRSVRDRARHRCEYCGLPQAAQPYVTFHIEHVLPRKHGGSDDPSNLALACERCTAFKGIVSSSDSPCSRQKTDQGLGIAGSSGKTTLTDEAFCSDRL